MYNMYIAHVNKTNKMWGFLYFLTPTFHQMHLTYTLQTIPKFVPPKSSEIILGIFIHFLPLK